MLFIYMQIVYRFIEIKYVTSSQENIERILVDMYKNIYGLVLELNRIDLIGKKKENEVYIDL